MEIVNLCTHTNFVQGEEDWAKNHVRDGSLSHLNKFNGNYAYAVETGEGNVRLTRSIEPPLRYAVVEHRGSSYVICANRIAPIISYVKTSLSGADFSYMYTRMVPPFTLVEIQFDGGSYKNIKKDRYIQPIAQNADVESIGAAYGNAIAEAIKLFAEKIPKGTAIGIPLSGGADSGLVYLLAHHVFQQIGADPANLYAYTLKIGAHAKDTEQAGKLVDFLVRHGHPQANILKIVEMDAHELPALEEIVEKIEDYKTVWDLQGAKIMIGFRKKLREVAPDIRYTLSGHGGDELAQDYHLGEEGLSFDEVIDNPHIYVEGRIHLTDRTNPLFSGGLGRRIVIDPADLYGFTEFSPLCTQKVVQVMYGVPKKSIIKNAEELYSFKLKVAQAALKAVTGLEYIFPEKNRFQCGATDEKIFEKDFRGLSETEARQIFHAMMQKK